MRDTITESGFTLLENDFSDLDIYVKDTTLLIAMKKFKTDRKAFRNAGNQIDLRMISELRDVFEIFPVRLGISGIILTSAHKVVFSRGAKIELLKDASLEECRNYIFEAQELISVMQNCKVIIVAALNGLTLGGGLELALACDYRIASKRENVILGFPEAHLGVLPAMGGIVNGKQVVGADLIFNMIHNFRMDINAEAALKCGLVDKTAEPDDLINTTYRFLLDKRGNKKSHPVVGDVPKSSSQYQAEIAEYLSTTELERFDGFKIAPMSALLLPFLLKKVNSENVVESLGYEREVFCYLQQTEDCIEGITALIEEREPQFCGK